MLKIEKRLRFLSYLLFSLSLNKLVWVLSVFIFFPEPDDPLTLLFPVVMILYLIGAILLWKFSPKARIIGIPVLVLALIIEVFWAYLFQQGGRLHVDAFFGAVVILLTIAILFSKETKSCLKVVPEETAKQPASGNFELAREGVSADLLKLLLLHDKVRSEKAHFLAPFILASIITIILMPIIVTAFELVVQLFPALRELVLQIPGMFILLFSMTIVGIYILSFRYRQRVRLRSKVEDAVFETYVHNRELSKLVGKREELLDRRVVMEVLRKAGVRL